MSAESAEERDIMQLVEVQRDSLFVHHVVRGLHRDEERERIEELLAKLPAGEVGADERDIMQLIDNADLSPEVSQALKQLRSNRSSFLYTLVRMAQNGREWDQLPASP